jgi:O-antigen/teichoic acid export membrane protein
MAEAAHQVIERSILGLRSGLSDLGIYTHSQQYRAIANMPISAVANSTWPVTLSDARADRGDFIRTKLAWNAVYLLLTCIGLAFATLGSHLIALLTHDKFTEAYILASLWIVYLLVQNTGKPQTGVFYARGAGGQFAQIQTMSMAGGTILLFMLVPNLGIYGAFMAAFVQQIALRVGVHIGARRLKKTPFQDHWAIVGTVLVLVTLWGQHKMSRGLLWDIVVLCFAIVSLGLVARRVLAESWRQVISRPKT